MIKLKSESNRATRSCRPLRLIFLLLILGVLIVVVTERWRGQWALRRWKNEMAAKGEVFEAQRLWPPASSVNVEFSKRLAQLTGAVRGGLDGYSGSLLGIVMEPTGQYRRGSQEPRPPRLLRDDVTKTWQHLDGLLQQSQCSLQSMRELMKHPPSTMGRDVVKCLEDDWPSSFVGVRIGAQIQQTAALNDLHNCDLEKALQDLETILAFAKLYERDPSLISFMIRIAIVGLSVDVCWDALQADGWTGLQLARLQQACLDIDHILPQMARTMESERAGRLYQYQWFGSHSYQAWLDRYREVYQGFGMGHLCPGTAPLLRQWIFHPLWSFAWADEEELIYLRQTQLEIANVREAAQRRSWSRLKERIAAQQQSYRRPEAGWRFYLQLPLHDYFSQMIGTPNVPEPVYPYPDFSRAWLFTMSNLTRHEMVITAIALKRYTIRHGRPLDRLAALVPDFLTALPTDLMDGQPLRYRLNPDGTFVLYSVGANLRDDGGDSIPESAQDSRQASLPWSGRDWVWLNSAAKVEGPQISRIALKNGSK